MLITAIIAKFKLIIQLDCYLREIKQIKQYKMNLNNFTIKSQEAVQQAQQIATGLGNQSIETGHLLKGILEVDENVTPFILQKLGVNINIFKQALEKIVESYSKVTGGDQFLSQNANKALQKASSLLKEFKDEFVSIELLLLGLLSTGDT